MNAIAHAYAHKIFRARASRDALRAILPPDIAWGIVVTRNRDIHFRGIMIGRFMADGRIATDRHSDPIAATDARALTRRFRSMFFPADYCDPLTAYDHHEELRAAYAAGDDDAVATALRRLKALEAPVAVA